MLTASAHLALALLTFGAVPAPPHALPVADPDSVLVAATPTVSVVVRGAAADPWDVDPPAPLDAAPLRPSSLAPDPDDDPEYSDAYFVRYEVHRYASYAMLPLFAAQYLAGRELMANGDRAAGWAKQSHGPLAAGVAGLFALNTVTGAWNLWDARKDPESRGRRTLHSVLMLAADAGFAATGGLAEDAEESGNSRNLHRNVAIGSMGLSLLSYAIMLPLFGN